MMQLIKLAIIGLLLALASPAVAQSGCGGQFAGGTLCGNRTGTQGLPGPTGSPVLGIPGIATGQLGLAGSGGGTAVIQPQSTAGTPTLLLPNTSGTLAASASSPLVLNTTTGALTCPTCVSGSGGALVNGTTPTSGYSSGQILSSNGTVLSSYSVSSANTASNVVVRDSSGNFSAGTITASLTGHASLDCILTGCTMSGAISLPAGSVSTPSINFSTPNVGIYSRSGNFVDIASQGSIVADFTLGVMAVGGAINIVVGNSATGANYVSLFADAANIIAQRNNTAAQALRVYNTFAGTCNGTTDVCEWGGLDWTTTANALTFGTFANGAGTGRGLIFKGSAVANALDFGISTANSWTSTRGWSLGAGAFFASTSSAVGVGSGTLLGFSSLVSVTPASTLDTNLSRVSAGIMQLGTTAANALGSLNLTNLNASGTVTNGGLIATGAAPTVAAAQIGYGSTTAAASNCGGGAVTACAIINVAGTTRYVPYY